MNPALPNAFLIGGAKCGTTSMALALAEHPNVWFSTPKEPNFFNTDFDVRYRKRFGRYDGFPSRECYEAMFAGATAQHRVRMEGSVWYLCSDVAVPSILREQPQARFVVMLRNPVDVAFSLHSQLYWSFQEEEADFARAWSFQERRQRGESIPPLNLEPRLLQYRTLCALGSQLERVLQWAGRERVHVLLLDDLIREPRRVYLETLAFLGLVDDGRRDFSARNENKRHKLRWLGRLRHQGLLGPAQHMVWKWNISTARRPPLDGALRAMLAAEFASEVRRIEASLGRATGWLGG